MVDKEKNGIRGPVEQNGPPGLGGESAAPKPDEDVSAPEPDKDVSTPEPDKDVSAPDEDAVEKGVPNPNAAKLFMADLAPGLRFIGRLLWPARRRARILMGVVLGLVLLGGLAVGGAIILLPQLNQIFVEVPAITGVQPEPTPTARSPQVVVIAAVLPTPTPSAIDRAVRFWTPVSGGAEDSPTPPVDSQAALATIRSFPPPTATPQPSQARPGLSNPPVPAGPTAPSGQPTGPTGPPVRLLAITEDARGQVVMRFSRTVRMEGVAYLSTDVGVSLGLVDASRNAALGPEGSRTLVWERRYVPEEFHVTNWDHDSVWTLTDLDGNDASLPFDPVRIGPIAEVRLTATPEPTPTETPVPTATLMPTPLPTETPTPTASQLPPLPPPTQTPTPTETPTPTPAATPTPTPPAEEPISPPSNGQPTATPEPAGASAPGFIWLDLYIVLPSPSQDCIFNALGNDFPQALYGSILERTAASQSAGVVEEAMLGCMDPTDLKKVVNLLGVVNLMLAGAAQREQLTNEQVACTREAIAAADLAGILAAEQPGTEWATLQASILQCLTPGQ